LGPERTAVPVFSGFWRPLSGFDAIQGGSRPLIPTMIMLPDWQERLRRIRGLTVVTGSR